MLKFLNYLALATSIGIASIAAYFSVLGLATIFAGAFMGIVIMAGALSVQPIYICFGIDLTTSSIT